MKFKEKINRANMLVRRKLIQKLGLISDQKYYLDSHFQQPRQKNVERLALYSDVCSVEYKQPINGNVVLNHYPPRYIYRLSNPTIDPISGLVYDSDGDYIAESSAWRPLRLLYSWPKPNIKTTNKVLKGEYLFLANEGFAHWLFQDLPAFIAAYSERPNLKVIVPQKLNAYVKTFLESLNVETVTIASPTKVESLVIAGKTAGQGNPMLGAVFHPKDVNLVRSFLRKNTGENTTKKKIYLSRLGYRRSPANESILQEQLIERGFEVFNADEFNAGPQGGFLNQIKFFSNVNQLVGVHGAGLSNMVWCSADAAIVELFSTIYIPSSFSLVSQSLGFNYEAIPYGVKPTDEISEKTMNLILSSI